MIDRRQDAKAKEGFKPNLDVCIKERKEAIKDFKIKIDEIKVHSTEVAQNIYSKIENLNMIIQNKNEEISKLKEEVLKLKKLCMNGLSNLELNNENNIYKQQSNSNEINILQIISQA